jgi:proteasome lid subunit RPN8/RPN11
MSTKAKREGVELVPFPGGQNLPERGELRLAIDKKPYAEIIGHAVVEPDVEVCGVLVGQVLRDTHGEYVHVTDVIRGQAAKQEGAAVTFTHETWNHIHRQMDERFADRRIVGWYHTHGGFGVFLSEMDTFVHQNFFPEPYHVAYVYDPLAGSEGFFRRSEGELRPLRRYWLGGRERKPAARQPEPESRPSPLAAPVPQGTAAVAALERAAAALQWSARERPSSLSSMLPWLVAGAAALFLVLDRAAPQVTGRAQPAGPVVVLDQDPASGRAVAIPLEVVERHDGDGVYRDAQGNLRLGLVLSTPGGAITQPGLLTALAPRVAPLDPRVEQAQRQADAAAAEARSTWRLVALVAAGIAAVAGMALAAWWYLGNSKRRA